MGNFLSSPITDKETHTGKGNGLAYGVSSMQGWRADMEDTHVACINPSNFPVGLSVFAICDGHGGKLVATIAAEKLTQIFHQVMEKNNVFVSEEHGNKICPQAIGNSMREAYLTLDSQMYHDLQNGYKTNISGSTAISAIITATHIIVANLGDSRSVLGKGGQTIPMSFDHKPINNTEHARILRAGGTVRNNRVNGDLAVSRGLGDYMYKTSTNLSAEEQQVSAEADIKIEPIDGTEEFLIIACDGIWDVMSNDDVCKHVRDLLEKGEADMGLVAEDILDACLRLGSRDNMSVVVILFSGARVGSGEGVLAVRRERAYLEQLVRDTQSQSYKQ